MKSSFARILRRLTSSSLRRRGSPWARQATGLCRIPTGINGSFAPVILFRRHTLSNLCSGFREDAAVEAAKHGSVFSYPATYHTPSQLEIRFVTYTHAT